MIELVTAGGYSVKVTGDHKIWTRTRGWVEAQHLTTADEIKLPNKPATVTEIGDVIDLQTSRRPWIDVGYTLFRVVRIMETNSGRSAPSVVIEVNRQRPKPGRSERFMGRFPGGKGRKVAEPQCAARATSSAVPRGTRPITSSVDGDWTSIVSRPAGDCHAPPM